MDRVLNPLRVFIADDSEVLRRGLASLLRRIEWLKIIGEAASIQDVLEALYLVTPDVVILDLRMPGGSGLRIIKWAKGQPHPPTVIVFSLSDGHEARCKAEGADFFVDKAAGGEPLVSVLQTIWNAQKI